MMERERRARAGAAQAGERLTDALARRSTVSPRCAASACCIAAELDEASTPKVAADSPSTPASSSTPSRRRALRLAPPLLVSDAEIDEAVAILGKVLAEAVA